MVKDEQEINDKAWEWWNSLSFATQEELINKMMIKEYKKRSK